MGNRKPSAKTIYLGILHTFLIIGLSFGSFSMSPWMGANAFADSNGTGNGGNEVSSNIRHLLARLANPSNVLTASDVIKIKDLSGIKYYDVGEVVWERFENELNHMNSPDRYENAPDISDIIEEIFKVAPTFTTQEHRHIIAKSLMTMKQNMEFLKSIAVKGTKKNLDSYLVLEEYYEHVEENLKTLMVDSPDIKLPRLRDPVFIKPRGLVPVDGTQVVGGDRKVISREEVEHIEEEMSKNVIGQPYAIKAFSNILYDTYTYGYGREKPKKLFLSGMPGTGKDTLAKEFVNAIHDNPKAYVDHLFQTPITKSNADLWALQGSTTGHVGSTNLTPFIIWLVKHSGGKYKIIKPEDPQDKTDPYVIENPLWKPGMVLDGYIAPEDSVLYVNEVDKWSKSNINAFLLRAMEDGLFQINNPGKGLDKITVPVNIIFASNDLIPAIAARTASGKRVGQPLSTEQLNENVAKIESDPSIFRNQLLSVTSKSVASADAAVGYSEEFINRLEDQELIPLRVLNDEALKSILDLNLKPLREKLKNSFGAYAGLEIAWNENLINFMHGYQRNPEEGARLMKSRITQLVDQSIMKIVKEQKIKPQDLPLKVLLDVVRNADGTSDLVLKRSDTNEVVTQTLIDATLSEKTKQPLTDAEFADLATLPHRLAKHVYGIDPILEKIGKAIALSKDAERRKRDGVQEHKKAEVFFLLGFSSTGKTETGKAVARELYKDGEASRVSIDFNNVKSIHDLRDMILGTNDGRNGVASKFMQEYDRLNGRGVFMFEEIANAPQDVLKALYDIMDEPMVTGFSDGKPRSMSQMVILATGNAGEEWYKGIPRDATFDMQMTAMRDIYDQAMGNLDFQRQMLEKYFSEAFINRIGISRFLFYPPFTHESIRKLAIGRIQKALEDLKPKEGERGWNIGFKNQADYLKLIETIEDEGFVLREQGRSIVNFVNEEFVTKIKWELRNAAVADGARVIIVPKATENKKTVDFDLIVEGQTKAIPMAMTRRPKIEQSPEKVDNIALTSFHEAGHNFLMKALLNDKFKATRVTRIPGVLMRESGPVLYSGMAESEGIEKLHYNREAVLEMIAVKLGGDVAESLVTKGGRRHAGISDDIERATELARTAVLKWGLSDVWGRRSVKDSEIEVLTDAEKKIVNDEVDKLLKDGRALAEAVMSEKGNFEVFKALGLKIFEIGDLRAADITAFYKEHESKINYPANILGLIEAGKKAVAADIAAPENNGLFAKRNHNVEFVDGITIPATYADINKIIAERKKAEVKKVNASKSAVIHANFNNASSASSVTISGALCTRLFQ